MSDNTRQVFSQRFRKECERLNLTQTEVAKIFGYRNYTTITKWESGVTLPSAESLVKMSNFFDVPIDYLLGLAEAEAEVEEEVPEPEPIYIAEAPNQIIEDLNQGSDSQLAYTSQGRPLETNVLELLTMSLENSRQIAERS